MDPGLKKYPRLGTQILRKFLTSYFSCSIASFKNLIFSSKWASNMEISMGSLRKSYRASYFTRLKALSKSRSSIIFISSWFKLLIGPPIETSTLCNALAYPILAHFADTPQNAQHKNHTWRYYWGFP